MLPTTHLQPIYGFRLVNRNISRLLGGVALSAAVLCAAPAWSEPLADLLPGFLENQNPYKAAVADVAAAGQNALASKGGFYPTLDVTATYGNEQLMRPSSDDTNFVSREADFSVTQRIWDNGATSATIQSAGLVQRQAEAVLAATRSALLLRAVTAYAGVARASEALKFALKSEQNIKKQTELENALVKRGAGFTTDVLQAKVQLAGAQARRSRAHGALKIAINAYRTLFKKVPGPIDTMDKLSAPIDRLPGDVEDAVERALKNNSLLIAANLASDIAQAGVSQTLASSYSPTIDGIIDYNWKRDVSGTGGNQREIFSKFEMNFPFNLGMTAANTLKASERSFDASVYRYADTKDQIIEQTRNAWEQFQTAQINAELLANQANIAGEFLQFARKERTLGRRSLLDVLTGETAEINARSDTASAQTDVIIAAYTLLEVMGELNEAALGQTASN